MPRLFVAAWPDEKVMATLHELPRADEPGVRWVPADNWHVTLRFLGDIDVDPAATALAHSSLPTAHIRLGPRVERLGPRQLVVPADGADHLASAVRSATSGLGERDLYRFRGHLTVARTKPNARSALLGADVSGEFAVTEVALVRSDLLPDGARYTTVAVFPTTSTTQPDDG